ncbi:hypothetical protein ACUXAV_003174 [Cupriavidus metallidurans]|jgi:hypothetical protein|uniref:CDP-diacylglycerol pyrophosphatase n=2 Tax=Cupriavidus metallidurans TaxID=119219 RepID=D3DYG1_CUPMC|nr:MULTISPECIES: hypothetical protein [Cupriavidus]HBD39259.1 CDP-diacylglycerol pyrophosphatase [Cupriavidus sp.]ADC45331.1 hypothetical protein Rmet_6752 [Cupriavidus metallidurans CH34]AVA35186.1 CDP-diacylglycerol pyrophosphatase [Cupriavidus metallidurans]ELA00189.1 hypothetical protein D769_06341 [Cupriavidus sp. HMR-1]KWR80706.1 CDP-diacylglycerol pyrophosphatase [Cupriavidus sp. SHE]
MRVTIRTTTIPGAPDRAALHRAAVYLNTEEDASPLMVSAWSQREPEAFLAAQRWARNHAYQVSNPRNGTYYGGRTAR